MRIVYNNVIPFKGFAAMYFFGILFVRKGVNLTDTIIRHETFHDRQAKEMLFVFFYLWYVIEWFVKLFFYGRKAYRNISFEREAYAGQGSNKALEARKHYAWVKYL